MWRFKSFPLQPLRWPTVQERRPRCYVEVETIGGLEQNDVGVSHRGYPAMKRIFVSVASEDAALGEWAKQEATRLGFSAYFQVSGHVRQPLAEHLEREIQSCDIFLAIWSKKRLEKTFAQFEADLLLGIDINLDRKILLNFRIDDVEIPVRYSRFGYIDAHLVGLDNAKRAFVNELATLASNAPNYRQPRTRSLAANSFQRLGSFTIRPGCYFGSAFKTVST